MSAELAEQLIEDRYGEAVDEEYKQELLKQLLEFPTVELAREYMAF